MAGKKTFRLTKRLLAATHIDEDLRSLLIASEDRPPGAVFCHVDGVIGLEYRDKDGKPHREDGPARFLIDGTETWFRHGVIHRDGDEPAIIYEDGEKHWYKDGKLHREGAPAITDPHGAESWFVKGELHRLDGPAIISAGRLSEQYWRKGCVVNKFVIDKEIREKEKDQLIADLKEQLKNQE